MDIKHTILVDKATLIFLETNRGDSASEALNLWDRLSMEQGEETYIRIQCGTYARSKGSLCALLRDMKMDFINEEEYEEMRRERKRRREMSKTTFENAKRNRYMVQQMPTMYEGSFNMNWAKVPEHFLGKLSFDKRN